MGNLHFAIGYGTSKSKSKKDAAQKIIRQSDLFSWLEENYPDNYV